MLNDLDLNRVLIIDIETIPQFPNYESMPENWQKLWDKKATFLKKNEEQTNDEIYPRAGIYAEFGAVICISLGFFNGSGINRQFRIKSFCDSNEKVVLQDFANLLEKHYSNNGTLLCAHNGKEFDFPYLCRRMLINKIPIPSLLNIVGKKPWEVTHIDTMELWKFGDFKNFTSLELLAAAFHIPTPKDDIDGSMVWHVYWQQNDLERIKTYCQKDIVTVAQLLLSFKNLPLLTDADIIISN